MHPKEASETNDRKEIFGWITYDWANSAFYTTVVTVLSGPYLQALARSDVGERGAVLSLGWLGTVTPQSMIPLFLGVSIFVQVFFLPVLGSIADYTHLKKKMMAAFSYLGVLSGSLLFFVVGDSYLWGCFLLMLGNMCFAAANVFYNAYLVDVVSEDRRDRVSLFGYAAGYLGGTLMLILNLVFIQYAESLGISKGLAVRISILSASLWWGVFGVVSFLLLRTRGRAREIPHGKTLVTVGFSELWVTVRELSRLRYTSRFLIAYLFYNDGIQTVILNSSVFIANEIFTSKGQDTDESFLLGIFLIAQVCALLGSLMFERIARVLSTKATILFSLGIWSCIVIYAYGFFETKVQAMMLGGMIGIVLGSTQALSRSLFSQMIPVGRESSFFGLYEISEKGTSWMGNIVFSVVVASTGSFRQALLAVIVFFVIGAVILIFTDVKRAIHESGNLTPEEASQEILKT